MKLEAEDVVGGHVDPRAMSMEGGPGEIFLDVPPPGLVGGDTSVGELSEESVAQDTSVETEKSDGSACKEDQTEDGPAGNSGGEKEKKKNSGEFEFEIYVTSDITMLRCSKQSLSLFFIDGRICCRKLEVCIIGKIKF